MWGVVKSYYDLIGRIAGPPGGTNSRGDPHKFERRCSLMLGDASQGLLLDSEARIQAFHTLEQ